jgi:hypothetical protein
MKTKPMKAASKAQAGSEAVGGAIPMSQPRAPGGNGFLIDHNQFTDARTPGAKGQKKSSGYPNFPRSTPQ